MGGKATVSGEQSKGFKRGEYVMVGCNMSLFGTYKINPETIQEWREYTESMFDSSGMLALKQIEEAELFKVKYRGIHSNFYVTNLCVDDKVVAVTEEELDRFCIKL